MTIKTNERDKRLENMTLKNSTFCLFLIVLTTRKHYFWKRVDNHNIYMILTLKKKVQYKNYKKNEN